MPASHLIQHTLNLGKLLLLFDLLTTVKPRNSKNISNQDQATLSQNAISGNGIIILKNIIAVFGFSA